MYLTFIRDCFVKNVIDLSPGAGVFALACLELALGYVGIVFSEHHASTLPGPLKIKVVFNCKPIVFETARAVQMNFESLHHDQIFRYMKICILIHIRVEMRGSVSNRV